MTILCHFGQTKSAVHVQINEAGHFRALVVIVINYMQVDHTMFVQMWRNKLVNDNLCLNHFITPIIGKTKRISYHINPYHTHTTNQHWYSYLYYTRQSTNYSLFSHLLLNWALEVNNRIISLAQMVLLEPRQKTSPVGQQVQRPQSEWRPEAQLHLEQPVIAMIAMWHFDSLEKKNKNTYVGI